LRIKSGAPTARALGEELQEIFDERLHGLIIVPKLQTIRRMKAVLE
jgi:hypothetical protein